MPTVKKKYKKVDQHRFMKILGGRKMAMRQIQDANDLARTKADIEEWNKVVNFGLPDITDLDGPAEC